METKQDDEQRRKQGPKAVHDPPAMPPVHEHLYIMLYEPLPVVNAYDRKCVPVRRFISRTDPSPCYRDNGMC
jgi:hypothetical protein